ncbi:MAG: hypothetical protein R6V05_12025 [Candidatus Brocadiia bacterium]
MPAKFMPAPPQKNGPTPTGQQHRAPRIAHVLHYAEFRRAEKCLDYPDCPSGEKAIEGQQKQTPVLKLLHTASTHGDEHRHAQPAQEDYEFSLKRHHLPNVRLYVIAQKGLAA